MGDLNFRGTADMAFAAGDPVRDFTRSPESAIGEHHGLLMKALASVVDVHAGQPTR